jgi:hypothetical protein
LYGRFSLILAYKPYLMPLEPILLPCGQQYVVSPKHRKSIATADASVWRIHQNDELSCFDTAYTQNWHVGGIAWGIIANGIDGLSILGESFRRHELKIAKFRQDASLWHGYPADNNYRPQDRPKPFVLELWINGGLISKALRSRIQGGRL